MERGHAGSERLRTRTQSHKHTQRIVCVGLYVRVCVKLPCSSPTDFISRSICTEPDALHCVGWNTEMLKLILAPPPSSPQKNNKLWSLFWIFTSHAVFLRMQNTFFIMHRILKNIHDQKIPPHNYSSENVI